MADGDGGLPDLAARLNRLFESVPQTDGRTLWNNETAAAEATQFGTPMSPAYLSQLRSGKRDNPSARHLAAIARIFGVPMEYFIDPDIAAKIDKDLRLLSAIRDSGVQGIALRAHGLSAESLAGLEGIIDQVRRLEHLPDQGGPDATNAQGDEAPPT